LKAADPIDTLSWTAQTRLRQSWEGLQRQFSEWLKSSSNHSDSTQWGWLLPILLWTLRIVGLVVLAAVLFLLIRQIGQWVMGWIDRTSRTEPSESSEPVKSRLDWLAIAQEAQSRQDYHRAFEALYRALLVQLHESGLLRQDAARTDREYIQGLDRLWSLSDKPLHLREDWVTLFRTHESLCFGQTVLQQRQFDQCRAAYESLTPYLQVSQSA
jgi:Domain of unknown function (DUF4129)